MQAAARIALLALALVALAAPASAGAAPHACCCPPASVAAPPCHDADAEPCAELGASCCELPAERAPAPASPSLKPLASAVACPPAGIVPTLARPAPRAAAALAARTTPLRLSVVLQR